MIQYDIKTKKGKKSFVMESDLNRIPLHEFLEYEEQIKRPDDKESEIQAAKYIYRSVGFWGKWSDTRQRIGEAANELSINEVMAIWKICEKFLFPQDLTAAEFFEIENEKYFYPSENLKDSKFGEFVNAQQLRHFHQKSENRNDEAVFLMALLCRKENEEAFEDSDKLEERVKYFKSNCTLLHLLTFSFFLLNTKTSSLTSLNKRLRALLIASGLRPVATI